MGRVVGIFIVPVLLVLVVISCDFERTGLVQDHALIVESLSQRSLNNKEQKGTTGNITKVSKKTADNATHPAVEATEPPKNATVTFTHGADEFSGVGNVTEAPPIETTHNVTSTEEEPQLAELSEKTGADEETDSVEDESDDDEETEAESDAIDADELTDGPMPTQNQPQTVAPRPTIPPEPTRDPKIRKSSKAGAERPIILGLKIPPELMGPKPADEEVGKKHRKRHHKHKKDQSKCGGDIKCGDDKRMENITIDADSKRLPFEECGGESKCGENKTLKRGVDKKLNKVDGKRAKNSDDKRLKNETVNDETGGHPKNDHNRTTHRKYDHNQTSHHKHDHNHTSARSPPAATKEPKKVELKEAIKGLKKTTSDEHVEHHTRDHNQTSVFTTPPEATAKSNEVEGEEPVLKEDVQGLTNGTSNAESQDHNQTSAFINTPEATEEPMEVEEVEVEAPDLSEGEQRLQNGTSNAESQNRNQTTAFTSPPEATEELMEVEEVEVESPDLESKSGSSVEDEDAEKEDEGHHHKKRGHHKRKHTAQPEATEEPKMECKWPQPCAKRVNIAP